MAPWPSGEARACKARYGGSIPPGVFQRAEWTERPERRASRSRTTTGSRLWLEERLGERDRAEDTGLPAKPGQRDVVGDVVDHGARFEIAVHEREHLTLNESE
jgi:hypothetical protein